LLADQIQSENKSFRENAFLVSITWQNADDHTAEAQFVE